MRFEVASATALDVPPASLGGILGWWSLFNLPRHVLPQVLSAYARALVPGGQAMIGTHVGDEDVVRREAFGGVRVEWTTHLWRPERLVELLAGAGLEPGRGDALPGVGGLPPAGAPGGPAPGLSLPPAN